MLASMNRFSLAALLALLLPACNQNVSGPMHDFCEQLSAGQWEQALLGIGTEQRRTDWAAMSEADRIITGAALSPARCTVTAQNADSATLSIDTVRFENVAREVMDDSGELLLALVSGSLSEAQELHLAEAMRDAANAPGRERVQLTHTVPLSEQEGRLIPTPSGSDALLSALSGDTSTATQ